MDLLYQVMRIPYLHGIWKKFPIGSVQTKVLHGIFPYANYAYGVYWSSVFAARLGIPRITVIEFGVAGGRGLMALEAISEEISADVGVGIDVVGFDAGSGMPEPADYRDLPHIWAKGFYKMDVEKLQKKLKTAQLVLGDVRETLPLWLSSLSSPIGFVAFDLDYYSSTKAALQIFDGPPSTHLPRVPCYFDDVCCTNIGFMNRYVGELLAIQEFNDEHDKQKVCQIEQLRLTRPRWEHWQERMYAFHNFSHELYTRNVIPSGDKYRQLPL